MKKTIYIVILILYAMIITMHFASSSNDEKGIMSTAKDYDGKTNIVLKVGEHILDKERKVSKFVLPESVRIIEDEAFEGISTVSIDLPENLNTIGDRAFANILTLRFVRIPKTADSIEPSAFSGSNLVSISAAPNSFASAFSRSLGIPFTTIPCICSAKIDPPSEYKHEVSRNIGDNDTTGNRIPEQQEHNHKENRIIGKGVYIFHPVQWRGPPVER